MKDNQLYSAGQYDSTIVPGKDAVLIDYAFYFENLKDFHGNNDSDICTIIATQIILGYYDTFANDKLVNDIYDKIAIETSNTKIISNFSQSPGTGKQDGIDSDQRFRDYLVDLTTQEIGESPVNQGMSTKEQIKLVKRYLNDSKLAYKLSTCEGNSLENNDITNHTKKIIRNTIDAREDQFYVMVVDIQQLHMDMMMIMFMFTQVGAGLLLLLGVLLPQNGLRNLILEQLIFN